MFFSRYKLIVLRITVLLLFVSIIATLYFTGFFSWYQLATVQSWAIGIRQWIKADTKNFMLATTLFFCWYSTIISWILPGGALSTVLAGYLFGWWAIPLVYVSSLVGASTAFVASRYLFGEWLQNKFATRVEQVRRLIHEHGARMVLVLRLIPVFPFFLLNIICGLIQLPYKTFMLTTAVGIIPSVVVFALAGRELTHIHAMSDILNPHILAIFLIAAALVASPIFLRKRV